MDIFFTILAFAAVACVGWLLAEAKGKYLNYQNNEQEEAVLQQRRQQLEQDGYQELGIADVVRTIATTGYSAV